MGNCLSPQVSSGSQGNQGHGAGQLPADLDLASLASLLKSANSPEQRTSVLQHISRATSKAGDEECAAARYTLIEAEGVLEPLTGLLHTWHRPAVRAAAVQAFCNLSYACLESLEPAQRMGGVIEATGEGLRALITAEGVRDGQFTACQALSNLACTPELVLPLLLSLGRLNSIANHLVASHSSDMATKATFAHALLNVSLHSVTEVQQLDGAGGLAAVLKLLDDPKGNAVLYERALCVLHNLIRAHQLLLATGTCPTTYAGTTPLSSLGLLALNNTTLSTTHHLHTNANNNNNLLMVHADASRPASSGGHSSGQLHQQPYLQQQQYQHQQQQQQQQHQQQMCGVHAPSLHTMPATHATSEGDSAEQGSALASLASARSTANHPNHLPTDARGVASPRPAQFAAAAAAPRYAELLRLPQVQVMLQRQLRRPPLQGGTGGSSNCRYLAAKVIVLLLDIDQHYWQQQQQQQRQAALSMDESCAAYSSGGQTSRGGPLSHRAHAAGIQAARDSVAGSLKHMAMSQLLEALQHALLQTPPEAAAPPAAVASRFQPQRQHQALGGGLASPRSIGGAVTTATDASIDSAKPLHPLRMPTSPSKGSPSGGTPRSARTCMTSCVNGSSPQLHLAGPLSSPPCHPGAGSVWVGMPACGTSLAPKPQPLPSLFGAHETLLETLVTALWGLCSVCCRPPRGHLPILAQGTADRLVLLLARRGPNAPQLLCACARMLCLMSSVDHSRRQMVAASAAPALVDLLAAALLLPRQGTPAKSTQTHHPQQPHPTHRHQPSDGTHSSSLPSSATKTVQPSSSGGCSDHLQQQQQGGGVGPMTLHSRRQLFGPAPPSPDGSPMLTNATIAGSPLPLSPSATPTVDNGSASEAMWGAAAAASKALRNMAVSCPSELLACPRALPQLLASLAIHMPQVRSHHISHTPADSGPHCPASPPASSGLGSPGVGGDDAPHCALPCGASSAALGGPLAEARAQVQRQCLTALISLTRAEPAVTCQAVLDVNGCKTIAEAIQLGLSCGSAHSTQVAAWNSALLCQLYISPVEAAPPAIHEAVLSVCLAARAPAAARTYAHAPSPSPVHSPSPTPSAPVLAAAPTAPTAPAAAAAAVPTAESQSKGPSAPPLMGGAASGGATMGASFVGHSMASTAVVDTAGAPCVDASMTSGLPQQHQNTQQHQHQHAQQQQQQQVPQQQLSGVSKRRTWQQPLPHEGLSLTQQSHGLPAQQPAQQVQQQQQQQQANVSKRKKWQQPQKQLQQSVDLRASKQQHPDQQQESVPVAAPVGVRSSTASLRDSLAAKGIGSLLRIAGPLPDTHPDTDQSHKLPNSAAQHVQHAQRAQRAGHGHLGAGIEEEDGVCRQSSSSVSSVLGESGCIVQLSSSSSETAATVPLASHAHADSSPLGARQSTAMSHTPPPQQNASARPHRYAQQTQMQGQGAHALQTQQQQQQQQQQQACPHVQQGVAASAASLGASCAHEEGSGESEPHAALHATVQSAVPDTVQSAVPAAHEEAEQQGACVQQCQPPEDGVAPAGEGADWEEGTGGEVGGAGVPEADGAAAGAAEVEQVLAFLEGLVLQADPAFLEEGGSVGMWAAYS